MIAVKQFGIFGIGTCLIILDSMVLKASIKCLHRCFRMLFAILMWFDWTPPFIFNVWTVFCVSFKNGRSHANRILIILSLINCFMQTLFLSTSSSKEIKTHFGPGPQPILKLLCLMLVGSSCILAYYHLESMFNLNIDLTLVR